MRTRTKVILVAIFALGTLLLSAVTWDVVDRIVEEYDREWR